MLTFAHPWFFVLLPLPVAAWWLLPAYRVSRPALEAPFLERLADLTGRAPAAGAAIRTRRATATVVLGLIWVLLVTAMARPQRLEEPVTRTVPARDLLLGVDLSGSMQAEDMLDSRGGTVDRLAATKEVLGDFLSKREGDRVGLIFFGNAPFVQAPFTDDLEVCRQLLDEAQVGMAGPRTMLGDAIGKAVSVFRESDLEEKVLILLTDGNDTGSLVPPVKAAAIARDEGVLIHCIAMGDPQATGEDQFDEVTLQEVAKTAGGSYFRAEDRAALEGVYDEIDRLTVREIESISHRPVTDLYHLPLATGFALSLLGTVPLLTRRAGTDPERAAAD